MMCKGKKDEINTGQDKIYHIFVQKIDSRADLCLSKLVHILFSSNSQYSNGWLSSRVQIMGWYELGLFHRKKQLKIL